MMAPRNPTSSSTVPTACTVPYGVTSVESRAVQEATLQAGAREAFLIPEPLAGAFGADLPVSTPTGNMVVDLGGGCSEAARLDHVRRRRRADVAACPPDNQMDRAQGEERG